MAGLTDPLIPLDAVRVGTTTVVPDASRPVAAIIALDSTVSWAVWPDAPMPDRAIGEARLWPALTGAWLIYTAEDNGTEMLQQRSAVFITAQGVGGSKWLLAPLTEEARVTAVGRIRAPFRGPR